MFQLVSRCGGSANSIDQSVRGPGLCLSQAGRSGRSDKSDIPDLHTDRQEALGRPDDADDRGAAAHEPGTERSIGGKVDVDGKVGARGRELDGIEPAHEQTAAADVLGEANHLSLGGGGYREDFLGAEAALQPEVDAIFCSSVHFVGYV